jgi:SAM-dependent methyltransferase
MWTVLRPMIETTSGNHLPPQHPRDISEDDLSRAMQAAARPDLLLRLVDISRRTFGFFQATIIIRLAYPWVARILEDLSPGSRVLDVSAALNPLPIFFAERGATVECLDPHPLVRAPPPASDWSEWGFFDYGRVHSNLTAHNCTIANYTPIGDFDAIYSAAGIAHMPCEVRKNALRQCVELLLPEGRLLLTADLIPATEFLWNFSKGRMVEPPEQHGTIADVLQQISGLGVQINEARVHRMTPPARTDLLFVACQSRPRTGPKSDAGLPRSPRTD